MPRLILVLMSAAAFAGCSTQQVDLTALVQGIQDLEVKHMALNDGFTAIANKAIEPSAQQQILIQRLQTDRSQYGAISQGLIRLAQTLGRVDYATLYQSITQTIWQIRNPNQPLPPTPTYYSVDVNR